MQAKQIIKQLEAAGFEHRRTKGSHAQYVRTDDSCLVTVPLMKRDLSIGTVMEIERTTGIDLRQRGIQPRSTPKVAPRP